MEEKVSSELHRSDKGFVGLLKYLVMSGADRANQINRSVNEYHPCSVDAFFDPSQGVYNSIVSGGDNSIRIDAMVAQTICALNNNFPVIILHEGNRELEDQMRSNFSNTGRYIEVSARSPRFEPFYGLTELEIANQVLEAAPKEYDISFNARYYIAGMSQFLNKSGKHLSFKMFSTCPHSLLFDKVDELRIQSNITDSEEQEIKSKLMMGQSESYKLDSYFASLKTEITPIMYVAKGGYKPVSVISALKKPVILCIDIVSITNKLLMNTLVYQLKLALTRRMRYTLLIDSIPINSNEAYAAYLKAPTDNVCKMIVADDFYSMTGSDDKLFSAVVGESQIIVVMGHTSSNSATKWSEVLGQYDKYEQAYSTSRGFSRRNAFSLLASPNQTRTVNISMSREFIVKPEMITRMSYGEAYILTAARGDLAHLVLNG